MPFLLHLIIALDIFFSLSLPRQNFLTHLIALVYLLFIGWCFLSKPKNRISAAFILQDKPNVIKLSKLCSSMRIFGL